MSNDEVWRHVCYYDMTLMIPSHSKRADIPVYSFAKHQRLEQTTSIYSPHVLVLEGIFALYDPRVVELLDMGIYCEADADTCLSRRSKLLSNLGMLLTNKPAKTNFNQSSATLETVEET